MCVAGEKVEVFFSRQKTTKCALGGGDTPSTSQLKLSLLTTQRILPTCVHQRRKALSERMIRTEGEDSIGSLMNVAAK